MKQDKLYKKALKKHEAEQRLEEAKRAAEEKQTGKPPPKGKAPPPKKGKDPDKPDIEVEQLPVPTTTPYTSLSGLKYVCERPLDEIIEKMLTPQEDESSDDPEEAEDGERENDDSVLSPKAAADPKQSALGKKGSVSSKMEKSAADISPPDGEEENEEDEKKDEEPKFLPNDYLEKAEMTPPKDPYGSDTMHPELLILHAALKKIVEESLTRALQWIMVEKGNYSIKVQAEGKDLQDKSVEELDQNLRK